MSDYLGNLAERALAQQSAVEPRPVALFSSYPPRGELGALPAWDWSEWFADETLQELDSEAQAEPAIAPHETTIIMTNEVERAPTPTPEPRPAPSNENFAATPSLTPASPHATTVIQHNEIPFLQATPFERTTPAEDSTREVSAVPRPVMITQSERQETPAPKAERAHEILADLHAPSALSSQAMTPREARETPLPGHAAPIATRAQEISTSLPSRLARTAHEPTLTRAARAEHAQIFAPLPAPQPDLPKAALPASPQSFSRARALPENSSALPQAEREIINSRREAHSLLEEKSAPLFFEKEKAEPPDLLPPTPNLRNAETKPRQAHLVAPPPAAVMHAQTLAQTILQPYLAAGHAAPENSSSPQAPNSSPTIRVNIGRLEVRAITPPGPAPRPKRAPAAPRLSLSEYLQQRSGGQR